MTNIPYRNGIDFLSNAGITGLLNPSSSDPTGAVNVGFLKNYTEGLKDPKDSVVAATATNLVGTYSSGAKTFTATSNGILSIDGYSPAVGDRVLPFGQTTGSQNGIYDVTSVGSAGTPYVLTRSADFNTTALVTTGAYAWVINGSTYTATQILLTTPDPIVLDTTSLTFTVINALNNLSATAPIIKVGNVLSFSYDSTTLQVVSNQLKINSGYSGQTSITTLGTISTGTWNGTAIAIANGGTGATTQSGAKANLGFASSGANSDITSLTGLTTALSISQGGTGATTASGARTNISAVGKYAVDVTSGSTTATINHALNTLDVTDPFIYDKVTKAKLYNVGVVVTDANNIALDFGTALVNSVRVIITG